ncbi:MAG: CoA-binding protein [Candidatus Zixiibacteriota bacterium]
MSATAYKPPMNLFDDIRTIAVAGVSRRKNKFGSVALRELTKRGYEVYPVHPALDSTDGIRCFHSLADLPVLPDMVLVTLKPGGAVDIVDQAATLGIRKVWFQQGADFSEAISRARDAGMEIVSRRCVLMYAGPLTGIHRVHRFFSRLLGQY